MQVSESCAKCGNRCARADIAALVWWCEEEDGLHVRWCTGDPRNPMDALTCMGGIEGIRENPQRAWECLAVRASTPAEIDLVNELAVRRGPRCYVAGAAQTAAVVTATQQQTVGPALLDGAGVAIRIKVGQQIACGERLAKEAQKRYCGVFRAPDSKGRLIEAQDAYTLCVIRRAPAGGWPK